MRKIYITIFTLVVLMISMTASVFAWFVDGQNKAEAQELSGRVVSPTHIDIEADFEFMFEMPSFEDLTYVTDSILNRKNSDVKFENLSTDFELTIENKDRVNAIKVGFNKKLLTDKIDGQYASTVEESLLYVAYSKNQEFPIKNSSRTPLEQIKDNNLNSYIEIAPGAKEVVVFSFWAYYDVLVNSKEKTKDNLYLLSDIYYALIYRTTITVSAQ